MYNESVVVSFFYEGFPKANNGPDSSAKRKEVLRELKKKSKKKPLNLPIKASCENSLKQRVVPSWRSKRFRF